MDAELLADVVRALLDDETKVLEWRQAHQAILLHNTDAAVVEVIPHLPLNPPDFVGRAAEFATITASAIDRTMMVDITVIDGMAGIGKTQLAIRSAHAILENRSFGVVLYVDLRGYDPLRAPADPAAVLDGFLRLMGVSGGEILSLDLAGRSKLFNSLAQSREILMLLDNAASVDQVTPLLPTSSIGVVLITSRRPLSDIAPSRKLSLNLFTEPEALELLAQEIGSSRVRDDIGSAQQITALCGHLPLYLALTAAQVRSKPGWSLADHVNRLKSLPADEAIRPALMASYQALSPPAQTFFQVLALHPGTDFTIDDASALSGLEAGEAAAMLRSLHSEHLIRRRLHGRYQFHNIVAAYAQRLANMELALSSQESSVDRLILQYLTAAAQAMDSFAPHDAITRPSVPLPIGVVNGLDNSDSAAIWLKAERSNLVAAGVAVAARDPDRAALLAAIIWRYLDSRAYYDDVETLCRFALSTRRVDLRSKVLIGLGVTAGRRGKYDEAIRNFRRAARLAHEERDGVTEARALVNLGLVNKISGRYRAALVSHRRARQLFAVERDRVGEARAIFNIGIVYEEMGRIRNAMAHYQSAAEIFGGVGDRQGLSASLGSQGSVLEIMGRYVEAAERYQRASEVLGAESDRYTYAMSLARSARLMGKLGRVDEGIHHQKEALKIFREIGHRVGQVNALINLGSLLHKQRIYRGAVENYEEAAALAGELGLPLEQREAYEGLAAVLEEEGNQSEAARCRQLATELRERLQRQGRIDPPEAGTSRAP